MSHISNCGEVLTSPAREVVASPKFEICDAAVHILIRMAHMTSRKYNRKKYTDKEQS